MTFSLPLVVSGTPEATSSLHTDTSLLRRTVLPGGTRVLTETMPGVRSVSIGAWVGVGSRDETSGHYGSTHFLEHLLFKGTLQRSAQDIAEAFDAVGGESNALTGKEHTCYYAKVIDTDLFMAAATIMDMVTSSVLDLHEFETERGVILEELAMNEDDPTDLVHERFAALVFGDHELGRPIGGTPQAITDVTRDAVFAHYQRTYNAQTLIVTAAGNVDHDELCAAVAQGLISGGWYHNEPVLPAPRRTGRASFTGGGREDVFRVVEQAHLMIGCEGLACQDKRRYDLAVLTAALGGGMSSRLFQEVREKRGLAYSVYAYGQSFADTGMFGMYAGCQVGKVGEVSLLLTGELERLASAGMSEDELVRVQGQLSGSMVLALEDTSARMSRLGKAELWNGFYEPVGEVIDQVRAVTAADVQTLAGELLARPRSVVRVLPRS